MLASFVTLFTCAPNRLVASVIEKIQSPLPRFQGSIPPSRIWPLAASAGNKNISQPNTGSEQKRRARRIKIDYLSELTCRVNRNVERRSVGCAANPKAEIRNPNGGG